MVSNLNIRTRAVQALRSCRNVMLEKTRVGVERVTEVKREEHPSHERTRKEKVGTGETKPIDEAKGELPSAGASR